MSVTAPPRSPRPSDPVTHGEFEALVEALIEAARQRQRRRRRRSVAVVPLLALAGVALFAVIERSTQSQTESPAVSSRSSAMTAASRSRIAFVREPQGGYAGVLYVMNADGSGERRLSAAFYGMRWSPDGKKIAFSTWDGLYIINADGSEQRQLVHTVSSAGVGALHAVGWWDGVLAWSPDAQKIAFVRKFGSQKARIYVINADGSDLRIVARMTLRDAHLVQLAWSPLGDKILFVSRPKGGDSEIFVMNPDGSDKRRLTRNEVGDKQPAWSPDGRKIAFVSDHQIHVMNADGSDPRRLTHIGAQNVAPAWSSDGQEIAFQRYVRRGPSNPCPGMCASEVNFEIHIMNADGSGQRRLTRFGARPQWSGDGKKLAFVSGRDGNIEVYSVNRDGYGVRNLTRTPERHERWFTWSPAQR